MWELTMRNASSDWVHLGRFATMREAAGSICALEGLGAVFLRMYVNPFHDGPDEEAFERLEHKGKRGKYVVQRQVN